MSQVKLVDEPADVGEPMRLAESVATSLVHWFLVSDVKPETGHRVMVYGAGGPRFGSIDERGQWRNVMGTPMFHAPKWWAELPRPI